MIVVSSREFRDSQKKYFDLAATERVIIKRKDDYLEIVSRGKSIPESPSPSNDPYFDDPRNIERILLSSAQIATGETSVLTKEMQKELFGS
ncbi:hypothetical protein AwDysgo_20870 [Bacteroidales bacterium]|nr:hypothetical protein AwDysgo_20870 [Bacteroidales bacterium]